MRLALRHTTRLDYDDDVVESVMDARLGPLSDASQRWERFDLRVEPLARIHRYTDGFDNAAHLITVAKAHRHLEVVVRSEVETLLADPFQPPREVRPLTAAERIDGLSASALVPRHAALDEIARRHAPSVDGEAFDAAQRLMHYVHKEFEYRTDVTEVTSTAIDVLEAGSGVCQDLAHVLIGLSRAASMPARYVSGYILTTPNGTAPKRGGDRSHAWAEVWTATHGWRGFDPTNDLVASEHHVKIGVGRDYRDVSPTRGSFRGDAQETLAVEVVTTVA
jgi:transglutaminase-like putative cysteine protease